MDTGEIKKLIEAFYNGETTPEEEKKLAVYFNGDHVDDELLDEKKLFLAMHTGDEVNTHPQLEQKLNNLIDKLAKEETKKKPSRRKLWMQVGSIAAGLALLVSAGLYFSNGQKPPVGNQPPAGTVNISEADEQQLEEAQDALILLSSKFNKGVNQLALVSSNFDKTSDIINKTINRKNEKES